MAFLKLIKFDIWKRTEVFQALPWNIDKQWAPCPAEPKQAKTEKQTFSKYLHTNNQSPSKSDNQKKTLSSTNSQAQRKSGELSQGVVITNPCRAKPIGPVWKVTVQRKSLIPAETSSPTPSLMLLQIHKYECRTWQESEERRERGQGVEWGRQTGRRPQCSSLIHHHVRISRIPPLQQQCNV